MTKPKNRPPITGDLTRHRRWLPHWQQGGSVYFLTFRTRNRTLDPVQRRIVVDALRFFDGERYTLHIAVVMPDHVHALLQPLERSPGEWWSLSCILHSVKSFSANRINTLSGARGAVWMEETFDRIVRDDEEFREKWTYISHNPVKAGLCLDPQQWDALYDSGTGWKPVPPAIR